ncbi:MAG: response regulator, partial [Sulfurimonas sp.]|nr:response regulator [Sulfurimonas sp.]
NKMNKAAQDGALDIRIDEKQYLGDFAKIVQGINGTMEATVIAIRDVGKNLNRLSNGDFQAQISTDYTGDYKVLQVATNTLGTILNSFIDASNKMNKAAQDGALDIRIDEKQYLGDFVKIVQGVNETAIINDQQIWIKNGISQLNEELSGDNTVNQVSTKAINFVSSYLNAGVGALYSYDDKDKVLLQNGSYSYVQREELSNRFKLGEGTVGQVALQRSPIQLKNITRAQMVVDTGTTSHPPLNTYTFPLIYQDELYGVIELGSSEIFDEKAEEFFQAANQIIATALSSSIANDKVHILLEETQGKKVEIEKANVQMEEANAQMEEQQQQLEEANAQMEEQQQQVEEANSQLKNQQEELRVKNSELLQSQGELDQRAEDLELSNKYKSEFLANMSHELRTPLNSIILLSEMLQENKAKHLSQEEVKKASVINSSGNELLRLISDVLDLSKIEAGEMNLIIDKFDSDMFCDEFQEQFEDAAKQKNLEFLTVDDYKGVIVNDKDKLSQVVRNLMSNSLKFTKEGKITLKIENTKDSKVKISVTDTGIGIPEAKAKLIFGAFQKADGGISRKYGGTGLGLSISKELAKIMGGEITLDSKENEGSIFSIIIPNLSDAMQLSEAKEKAKSTLKIKILKEKVEDDKDIITAADKPFLIIEDDEKFAAILKDKINAQKEYALIALNGEDGLNLAKKYELKGVMLNLGLPDMDGIDILKKFKTSTDLRKTPIYVISSQQREMLAKEHGAIGYAHKPVSGDDITVVIDKIKSFNNKKVKDILIVEDNKTQRESLLEFIRNSTVKSKRVESAQEAIDELNRGIYDAVIIDLKLKKGSRYDICEHIKNSNLQLPIIIYTGKELTTQEETRLRKYTDSIIIKTASSETKLMDEIDMFMHRVKVDIEDVQEDVDSINLNGKKILLVDDDIRNIYVLSEVLSSKGANIITASDGKKAIETLKNNLDTDIILMDLMMPVMDGYKATKRIKEDAATKDITIIALTAKAMPEDKQKALDVGCSDYITKPVKMNVLIGIIKGWLSKK